MKKITSSIGNLHTLKRELNTDKAMDYTVVHSPLDAVLGRLGASMGAGFASSLSNQMQSEQTTKLQ